MVRAMRAIPFFGSLKENKLLTTGDKKDTASEMAETTNVAESRSHHNAIHNLVETEGTPGVSFDDSVDLFLGLAQETHRRRDTIATKHVESSRDADEDLFDIWRTAKQPKDDDYHLLDRTPRVENIAENHDRARKATEAAAITASQIDAFAKRNASNDTVSDIFDILGDERDHSGGGGISGIADNENDHDRTDKPSERGDISINFNNRWHVIAIGILLGLILIPTIMATSWLTKEVLISTLEEEYLWKYAQETTTVTRTITASPSTGSERPGVQLGTLTLTHYLYSTATTVTTTLLGETTATTITDFKPVITTPASGYRGGLRGRMWTRTVDEADLVIQKEKRVKEDLMTSTGIIVFVTIETELPYTERRGQKDRASSTRRD